MVDEYIIHHDASFHVHITISIKQDIIIVMVSMHGNMSNMDVSKISIIWEGYWGDLTNKYMNFIANQALEEFCLNILDALIGEYCKHLLQNMFKVLSLLSTNLWKEQLFIKVFTT